jgi:adenosylmethionine-8-amino-7-oxononanoate aminotransferase
VIKREGPDTVGAIHTDVIDVHNGVIVPPVEYFRRIREMCDRYEVLLIADEVITGIGRTGKMFAAEHYGLVPDIMTLAKGITSGYQPLGATLVQSDIAERFEGDIADARHFSHAHTYGGNPVSCAAGLATLKEVEERNLVERVATLGGFLSRRLDDLTSNRFVHSNNVKGLLAHVELFRNKDKGERFDDETGRQVCQSIEAEMAHEGVLLHMILRPTVSAYISPPYIISEEQIDLVATKLEASIYDVCSRYS